MEIKSFVYIFSRFLFRLGLKIWNRFQVFGGNNMPAQGGVIIASNHASFLDPPIVGCGLRRHVRFLARDSLFQNGIGAWWARNVGVVCMDRNRGDIAAFKAALSVLQADGVLCLFPEGTRTLDGNLQPPKAGIGFLIMKAEAPVVPVYVEGSFAAFPKGAKWIRPSKITVRYGPPITPAEFRQLDSGKEKKERKDIYNKAAELVMAKITELKPSSENGLKKACLQ